MQEAATAEGSRPQNMAQIHNTDWDVSRDTLMKTTGSEESWYIVLELRNLVMVLSHYHYTAAGTLCQYVMHFFQLSFIASSLFILIFDIFDSYG